MFTPVSSYVKYRWRDKDVDLLIFKSVDPSTGVEVFRLGACSSADDPDYDIYCIKNGEKLIPFGLRVSEKVGSIALKDFSKGNHFYINPAAQIDIVDVNVINLGVNLKELEVVRGCVLYMNVWLDRQYHGYQFEDLVEKELAIKTIQESIPQLFFENYSESVPHPLIVRNIKWESPGVDYDRSGRIEKESLDQLDPKTHEPESLQLMAESLEKSASESSLAIEKITAVFHKIERMRLYYNQTFLDSFLKNYRVLNVLRGSYETYYKHQYDSFENFLVFIVTIFCRRMNSRDVLPYVSSKG